MVIGTETDASLLIHSVFFAPWFALGILVQLIHLFLGKVDRCIFLIIVSSLAWWYLLFSTTLGRSIICTWLCLVELWPWQRASNRTAVNRRKSTSLSRPVEAEQKGKMLRLFVILSNMFVAHASLNHSLSEIAIHSCRNSVWPWLAAHLVYTFFFSMSINGWLHCIGGIINLSELAADPPGVHYRRLQGQEREVAIKRGYRRMKLFVVQLIALTFVYTLGGYYYRSMMSNTPTSWLSIARWLIEASCDYQFLYVLFVAARMIPTSQRHLNNHFGAHMNMLLIIKMNQFVMMRYAEFHSQSYLNNTLVGSFYLFCDTPHGHSLRKIFPAHLMPLSVNHVQNVRRWLLYLSIYLETIPYGRLLLSVSDRSITPLIDSSFCD